MNIEFNFNFASMWESFLAFSVQDPVTIAWQLFFGGGWIIFLIMITYGLYTVWLDYKQGKFSGKWKYTLLAIDIPRENEQTPKAVESIFTAISGAYTSSNLLDKYFNGKVTESFSFEIVSLEGYIQFLVRTPSHFRDLVETAVYAQYPEAEITEVEDYTEPYKDVKFPNDKYNLWGTELMLVKDYPYPIRSYTEYEYQPAQIFVDPMAGLLEVFSRFGPGEQAWLQIVITPKPPGWGGKAEEVVKKFMGEEYKRPETWTDQALKPIGWLGSAATSVTTAVTGMEASASDAAEADQWKMFRMSPGERLMLEGIQKKLSKNAFGLKFRYVYLAETEIFSKPRGVSGVMGAIGQFGSTDGNAFKPGKRTKTGADYFNIKKRLSKKQNTILRYYRSRTNYYGDPVDNQLVNQEELASLWHFPLLTVKAPTLEKVGSKKVIPPTRLPRSERNFAAFQAPPAPTVAPVMEAPRTAEVPPGAMPTTSRPAQPSSESGDRPKPQAPPNLPTA